MNINGRYLEPTEYTLLNAVYTLGDGVSVRAALKFMRECGFHLTGDNASAVIGELFRRNMVNRTRLYKQSYKLSLPQSVREWFDRLDKKAAK